MMKACKRRLGVELDRSFTRGKDDARDDDDADVKMRDLSETPIFRLRDRERRS